MSTRDLLIEIGTEELPPKALKRLSDAFTQGIVDGLKEAELGHGEFKAYATPRRLAVLVSQLEAAQADKEVERRGPAVTAAFGDDGCPTKAALGFASSCGVTVEDLEKLETDKGAWLVFRQQQKGATASSLIPDIVQASLDKLPIPKRMRWGALESEFVRPVHWVVLLFGDEVIDAEILSIHSGRETRGHRFHHTGTLYLGEPAAYAPLLETEGRVIADFADRREAIRAQVLEAANQVGGNAVIDEDLLDEVTGLVEWPVAIIGNFEERFLEVPAEALISAMKGHQKYFHVLDKDGRLMPHFITLSNIESHNPDVVRAGNERVIRPRLSDADFFWTQDRKKPLKTHIDALGTVVFQKKLGTLADKTNRVTSLSEYLAMQLDVDTLQCRDAAQLCKCDLMSEMVYEFPELQGIMGRYYAQHEGYPAAVADALDEVYMPRHAGDDLPSGQVGQVLAIADRIDTLVGIFAIGQKPTGTKDPFALRRAALGVLRIIIENGLNLDLKALLEQAASNLKDQGVKEASLSNGSAVDDCLDYMLERLKAYYADRHISHDVIDAVLELRPTQPVDFDRRVRAVEAFRKMPEAESLAAANKRIANILRKSEDKIPDTLDEAKLSDKEEIALAKAVTAMADRVKPLFAERQYEEALTALAGLRDTVDTFFDEVMVNVDDASVRTNRLCLLRQLQNLFLEVADLSRLQG